MQYIHKQEIPPVDWDLWFTIQSEDGIRRSYDYGIDCPALLNLHLAKGFLLNEQNGLCAYCQKTLNNEDASIEHIAPKEHNLPLSTNYYNLVAVCRNPVKDPVNGRSHCDKERGGKLLPTLIFYKNCNVTATKSNAYFEVYSNRGILPKNILSQEIKSQVQSFIDILNLNSHLVVSKPRKGCSFRNIGCL